MSVFYNDNALNPNKFDGINSNAQSTGDNKPLRMRTSVLGSIIYPGFQLGLEKVYRPNIQK